MNGLFLQNVARCFKRLPLSLRFQFFVVRMRSDQKFPTRFNLTGR